MSDDGHKTFPLVVGGGRSRAVLRLRGWERFAYLGAAVATTVTGGLVLVNQLGGRISHGVVGASELIAAVAAVAAFAAFIFAMFRYEGETEDVSASGVSPLLSRFRGSQ